MRDSEDVLEVMLSSALPHVGALSVVDTGSSTGKSLEIVERMTKEFGVECVADTFTGCNDEEGRIADFSAARNRAWGGLAGLGRPWALWLDPDDLLVGGEALSALPQAGSAGSPLGQPLVVDAPYDLRSPVGEIWLSYLRERVVSPCANFEWVGAVHEVLEPRLSMAEHARLDKVLSSQEKQVVGLVRRLSLPGFRVEHRHVQRSGRDPQRNLRILRRVLQVSRPRARDLFYCGRELLELGECAEAIEVLRRYLEVSTWPEEAWVALRGISEAESQLGRHAEAEVTALEALKVRPWVGESFVPLARLAWRSAERTALLKDSERCLAWCALAQATPSALGSSRLFIDPQEIAVEVPYLRCRSLYHLGRLGEAYEVARTLSASYPRDPRSKWLLDVLLPSPPAGSVVRMGEPYGGQEDS